MRSELPYDIVPYLVRWHARAWPRFVLYMQLELPLPYGAESVPRQCMGIGLALPASSSPHLDSDPCLGQRATATPKASISCCAVPLRNPSRLCRARRPHPCIRAGRAIPPLILPSLLIPWSDALTRVQPHTCHGVSFIKGDSKFW